MKSIRPASNYVLVKPDEAESKTDGGIILPKTSQENTLTGTVLSVGDGRYEYGKFIDTKTHEGDQIIFEKHSARDVKVEGIKCKLIRETDIIGYIIN